MKAITYGELIKETAKATNQSIATTKKIMDAYFEVIDMGMRRGDKVHTSIGTFSIALRQARSGTLKGGNWHLPAHYMPVLHQSNKAKSVLKRVRS